MAARNSTRRGRISARPRRSDADTVRNLLFSVAKGMEDVRSVVAVTSAALACQNADHDADAASLLRRLVNDPLVVQISLIRGVAKTWKGGER